MRWSIDHLPLAWPLAKRDVLARYRGSVAGLLWALIAPLAMVAIYALVVVSSLAGTRFSLKSALLLGTILAIGSYLTFIIGLSLQFQVWPTFITG